MVPFIYSLLFSLMLLLLYLSGRGLQTKKKHLLFFFLIGFFAFALNEGLRYGRNFDYNLYASIFYEEYPEYPWKEILFRALAFFFHDFGFSWQWYVFLMSASLIAGTYYFFFKCFREILSYVIPLTILFSFYTAENLVRWYFAFSFFLTVLPFLLKERKNVNDYILFSVTSVLICLLIHRGFLVVLPFFIAASFAHRLLLKPVYLSLIFVLCFLISNLDFLNNFFTLASFTMSSLGFEYDVKEWLTHGNGTISAFYPFLVIFMVCLAYKPCKKLDYKYVYIYNIVSISAAFYPIFGKVEALNRLALVFLFFQGVLFSVNIYYYRFKRFMILKTLIVLLLFVDIGKEVVKPFTEDPNKYMYIWNKSENEPYWSKWEYWVE